MTVSILPSPFDGIYFPFKVTVGNIPSVIRYPFYRRLTLAWWERCGASRTISTGGRHNDVSDVFKIVGYRKVKGMDGHFAT